MARRMARFAGFLPLLLNRYGGSSPAQDLLACSIGASEGRDQLQSSFSASDSMAVSLHFRFACMGTARRSSW